MNGVETTTTLRSSAGAGKTRFYRIAVDGSRLVRVAWTEGRTPRETVVECDSEREAARESAKLRGKKLREGFAYVADAERAAHGDVVFDVQVPNRCSAEAFDLSPDGRTLVVGTMLREAYGAELHLIDVGTGERRLVHAEAVAPTGEGAGGPTQTFLHAALFDATGTRLVYAMNGETRLLDLGSGETQVLARYEEFADARFNPFRLRPALDAARRRLLLFDAGDRVRVLGPERSDGGASQASGAWGRDPLFETGTARPGFECWAAGLSPSGRLLALCFSRGSRYRADDPQVTEVEIWDVDRGVELCRIPMGRPAYVVGFDPSETELVAAVEFADGPCAFSVETGRLLWHFPDPFRDDRWATCYGWAYSPDGGTLAIGRRGETEVVDAATRRADPAFAPIPGDAGTGRTRTVRFSADGGLMAAGGDSGRIILRRRCGPGPASAPATAPAPPGTR
ncbi:WD40 repeat domain-containing protein [Streptomyces sp. B6B3]|uniref:WD40 repeat domain-containing protein n=1 Tax=Streptomyces sp. B6B3 TaxID=3153570 RepID=UPI00325C5D12